jgi:hypothetical protein
MPTADHIHVSLPKNTWCGMGYSSLGRMQLELQLSLHSITLSHTSRLESPPMPTHPVEQVGTSVNKAQRRPRRAREKSSPKGRRTPAPTPWRSSARHHQSGRLETFFKIPDDTCLLDNAVENGRYVRRLGRVLEVGRSRRWKWAGLAVPHEV